MFFFTHLSISKALYQYFSKELILNRSSFAYGNIKPDLPINYKCHHTLENCIFTAYNEANRLMENECSEKELSAGLGEICHYVSDFFCYSHLNEEVHNKKLSHFIYELKLHRKICRSFSNQSYIIEPTRREPRKDITSIIIELRKNYFLQPKDMKRDIEYALQATTWVCESLIYYMKARDFEKTLTQRPATIYKI